MESIQVDISSLLVVSRAMRRQVEPLEVIASRVPASVETGNGVCDEVALRSTRSLVDAVNALARWLAEEAVAVESVRSV